MNRIKNLVSIVTPCYNAEKYLYRLMDSIVNQDYPAIEMFAIDDGSTDGTKEVILSYIPKFFNKKYQLTYIFQQNAGQAAALNNGLKYVKGEYLVWPDSDDYYSGKDSISRYVSKFKELDESYGAVCFIGSFVDEWTQEKIRYSWIEKLNHSEELFLPCLLGDGILVPPISYMISMKTFDQVNPSREIYHQRQPQNFQMYLPLFYSYKCYTERQQPLSNIVVRSDSHSHKVKSYEEQLDDLRGFLEIKQNTLNQMSVLTPASREKYNRLCEINALESYFALAFRFGKYNDARKFTDQLKDLHLKIGWKRKMKLIILSNTALYKLYNVLHQFL